MRLRDAAEKLDVSNCDLSESQFADVKLAGSTFTNVDLSGLRMEDVSLAGTKIRNANLSNVSLEDCAVEGMTLNGILVDDLISIYQVSRKG